MADERWEWGGEGSVSGRGKGKDAQSVSHSLSQPVRSSHPVAAADRLRRMPLAMCLLALLLLLLLLSQ